MKKNDKKIKAVRIKVENLKRGDWVLSHFGNNCGWYSFKFFSISRHRSDVMKIHFPNESSIAGRDKPNMHYSFRPYSCFYKLNQQPYKCIWGGNLPSEFTDLNL